MLKHPHENHLLVWQSHDGLAVMKQRKTCCKKLCLMNMPFHILDGKQTQKMMISGEKEEGMWARFGSSLGSLRRAWKGRKNRPGGRRQQEASGSPARNPKWVGVPITNIVHFGLTCMQKNIDKINQVFAVPSTNPFMWNISICPFIHHSICAYACICPINLSTNLPSSSIYHSSNFPSQLHCTWSSTRMKETEVITHKRVRSVWDSVGWKTTSPIFGVALGAKEVRDQEVNN